MPTNKVVPNSQKGKTFKKNQLLQKGKTLKETPKIDAEESIREKYVEQQERNDTKDTESTFNISDSDSDSNSNSDNNSNKEGEINTSVENKIETTNEINTTPNVDSVKIEANTNTFNDKPISTITNIAKQTIRFSFQSKNYSFLSNYYCVDIAIDNKQYYHVEGYYQCHKFVGDNDTFARHIQFIPDPIVANKRGNSYLMTDKRREEWTADLRDKVMKQGVYTKFIANSELLKKLVDTGESILIQNSFNDTYWGVDDNGNGMNKLGKILMELRSLLLNIV